MVRGAPEKKSPSATLTGRKIAMNSLDQIAIQAPHEITTRGKHGFSVPFVRPRPQARSASHGRHYSNNLIRVSSEIATLLVDTLTR